MLTLHDAILTAFTVCRQRSMSIFFTFLRAVVEVFRLGEKKRIGLATDDTLAPFMILLTARLRLRIEAVPTEGRAFGDNPIHLAQMRTSWRALAARGFKQLAQLAGEDARRFIAGQHPDTGLIALVVCAPLLPPFLEFIAISPANVAHVITGEPGARAVQLASLTVQPHAAPTPEQAIEEMDTLLPGRQLDARMLILLLERLHVARMDSQLTRAPSLAEMRAQAAVHGIAQLDVEHEQQALAINRHNWLAAVRVALLDNARRKLKLDEEVWALLADNVVVVHNGMDADEVIATLSEHDLVDKLGAQLKRQKFGPAQIFDEINRRLDPAQQRHLMLNLGVPVQARLFASAKALRAAGVEAMMVAA